MRKPVFGVLAVSVLLLAWPAAAQELQSDQPRQTAKDAPEQPAVTLASAEVRLPTDKPKEVSEEPAKRPRAKRVTSCRCGDEPAPQ